MQRYTRTQQLRRGIFVLACLTACGRDLSKESSAKVASQVAALTSDEAGLEAGAATDSGAAQDAAATPDAGATSDAGSAPDAGFPDAGSPSDAGSTSDAAAVVDGGSSTDGGTSIDAGPSSCVPTASNDTSCDGRDDDCDGRIDEDCDFPVANCPQGSNVIEGTPGDDWLVGTPGDDCILGREGNDVIWGMEGDDVLVGGPGDDKILGFDGDDVILGGAGNDALFGGSGRDQIEGGAGNDVIEGGSDADSLSGGACNDLMVDDSGKDTLSGGPGADRLISSAPASVQGGDGFDACDGSGCELSELDARCRTDADCVAGRLCSTGSGICIPEALARDTTCDGQDDDCDGKIDEDYVSQPTQCGIGACAAAGSMACVNGVVRDSCTPRPPIATVDDSCDGIDDDCDGSRDEDFVALCGPSGVSSCADGVLLTTSCDDGDLCTNDTCAAAACSHTPVHCDDGNGCTTDSCDPILGCVATVNVGASCDDLSACTIGDHCDAAGGCVGVVVNPDDANPCTDDLCDPASGVQHLVAVGRACEDGSACTLGDACNAIGACVPGALRNCSDGLFCNGAEGCDPAIGCVSGAPPVVDDGISCTTDVCDETAQAVLHTPNNATCDDGLFCNGSETCNPSSGCVAGTPPALSDGVACTIDTCDEGGRRILHQASNAACNDGNPCNGSETCDAAQGCQAGTPIPVDDGNLCTIDSCDPATGQPVHTPDPCDDHNPCTDDSCVLPGGCAHANNSRSCKDGSNCTIGDACANGSCFGGVALDCNDFNDCTAESCDVQANHCSYTPLADGTSCSSGAGACNSGSCVVGCTPSAHPPSVDLVVDQHAVAGLAFSFLVGAQDLDGGTLTYASVGTPLPAGLTLDPNSGEIHGTPAPAALNGTGDTHGHVIRVSDGCLSTYTQAFSFQVSGVPLPPPFALFDFDDSHSTGTSLQSVDGAFNGAITGGVTTGLSSRIGQRFLFGGFNGNVWMGDANTALKTAGDMTVSVALELRGVSQQTYYSCGIAGAEGPGTSYAYEYAVNSDGTMGAFHEDNDANRPSQSVQKVSAGFNQLSWVRDATARTYRHYLQGLEDSGGAVSYASNASSFGACTPTIGSNNNNNSFANAYMDELAVWHAVLDANQVATAAWLYRKGIPIQAWINGETSCQGLLAADPGGIDGVYLIAVGNQTQVVSCAAGGP